jgi:hypothetical protein
MHACTSICSASSWSMLVGAGAPRAEQRATNAVGPISDLNLKKNRSYFWSRLGVESWLHPNMYLVPNWAVYLMKSPRSPPIPMIPWKYVSLIICCSSSSYRLAANIFWTALKMRQYIGDTSSSYINATDGRDFNFGTLFLNNFSLWTMTLARCPYSKFILVSVAIKVASVYLCLAPCNLFMSV